MAAPPPEGFSPWPQELPAAGSAGRSPGAPPGPSAEGLSPIRRRSGSPSPAVTPWLWLPVALSSLLLVLVVVVVNRQRDQAERIGALQGRVQTLEQSRALERTAVLEQQLRSMLSRLQDQEKRTRQLDQLGQQLQSLQQELKQLRGQVNRSPLSPLDESQPEPSAAPPARPWPRSPASP